MSSANLGFLYSLTKREVTIKTTREIMEIPILFYKCCLYLITEVSFVGKLFFVKAI